MKSLKRAANCWLYARNFVLNQVELDRIIGARISGEKPPMGAVVIVYFSDFLETFSTDSEATLIIVVILMEVYKVGLK